MIKSIFGEFKTRAGVIGLIFGLAHSSGAAPLPRATPESTGVSSQELLGLVGRLDQEVQGMHSVMVLKEGKVILEGWWGPYNSESVHVLYSLSKSFTSTAVGLAIAEGKLKLTDRVVDLFPDDLPENPSNNLKAMRVSNLLTMSAGHQDESPTGAGVMTRRTFLAHPVPHKPGTHFRYNTPATFMLSAMVQKQTGQTVLDYLRPRLFEPLGIENAVWDTNQEGICLGGYGLRVRTEDIAKFGQLYLQQGSWNGSQLLSSEWVKAATGRQVSNGSNPESDWEQGYGYQFWQCRFGAYRGDGAFGQYCVVHPEKKLVVAITSGVRDMGQVLRVLWESLLPIAGDQPLSENPTATAALQTRLSGLMVPLPEGQLRSEQGESYFGKKLTLTDPTDGLEWARLEMSSCGKELIVSLFQNGQVRRYEAGFSFWKKANSWFPGFDEEPIAGSAAWLDSHTLRVDLCAFETPFIATQEWQFDGENFTLKRRANVGFGSSALPDISGKISP